MSSQAITPDEWADMTESEREQYKQDQKDRLDSAIGEEYSRLDEQAQEAFDALDAGAPEAETHTIELTGGQEIEVIDSMPGHLEKKASNVRSDDTEGGINSVIEVMTHLVQTEGYDNPAVWEMFYERHGAKALMTNAMRITEPYYQAQKKMAQRRDAVGN